MPGGAHSDTGARLRQINYSPITDLDEAVQHVYIADRGNVRIVQLQKDGQFVQQFRPAADDLTAFTNLQDLFVDELGQRLFILANNRLYVSGLEGRLDQN